MAAPLRYSAVSDYRFLAAFHRLMVACFWYDYLALDRKLLPERCS